MTPPVRHAGVAALTRLARCRMAVFLGAGASKPFGYPLTRDLLQQIVRSLARNESWFLKALRGDPRKIGASNRKLLQQYLLALLPGESLSRRNLPLVTTLLSLLDYSLTTGQSVLASQSADRTRQARRLIERGILEVIDDQEDFSDEARLLLRRFCAMLTDLRRFGGKQTLPVITTNYDMAADEAVFTCARVPGTMYWDEDAVADRIDFGFPWLHPETERVHIYVRPQKPQFQLLKLHGSTNWLRCPLCDNVYINPWEPIWHQAYRTTPDVLNICHCSPTQLEPQIVSPSFVREMRAANLLSIWKAALDALRAADHWLVIGYSFPDEDLAIRALFTRAYGSRDRHPRITVIQKDDAARNRFEAFFEPGSLTYCTGGVESLLDSWETVPGRTSWRTVRMRERHRAGRRRRSPRPAL